jgi:hypothetical protein
MPLVAELIGPTGFTFARPGNVTFTCLFTAVPPLRWDVYLADPHSGKRKQHMATYLPYVRACGPPSSKVSRKKVELHVEAFSSNSKLGDGECQRLMLVNAATCIDLEFYHQDKGVE